MILNLDLKKIYYWNRFIALYFQMHAFTFSNDDDQNIRSNTTEQRKRRKPKC